MTAIAPTLQSFFTDYLQRQLGASPRTIIAYRDSLRLLLTYTHQQTGTLPADLDIAQLDATVIAEFLTTLEQERHNSARTRNARLAAIHSLFRHASLRHPEHAEQIARILAIPTKRTTQTIICWLTNPEVDALLDSPDPSSWTGRRDRLLLQVMITTGLRVSETTSLTAADIKTSRPRAYIACRGKGRKERITPIDQPTATLLDDWLTENTAEHATAVFRARGTTHAMTTDAVARRVTLHAHNAAHSCASIATKNVTPHVLRHTCAMRMLTAGIDANHHRPLARTRISRLDQRLHPRRPRAQTTGPGPHDTAVNATRTLPTGRQTPRLPRRPIANSYPAQHRQTPPPPTTPSKHPHNPHLQITGTRASYGTEAKWARGFGARSRLRTVGSRAARLAADGTPVRQPPGTHLAGPRPSIDLVTAHILHISVRKDGEERECEGSLIAANSIGTHCVSAQRG